MICWYSFYMRKRHDFTTADVDDFRLSLPVVKVQDSTKQCKVPYIQGDVPFKQFQIF